MRLERLVEAQHIYIEAGSFGSPSAMPVREVAQLVSSKCEARNTETSSPIWARPDARVSSATGQYPDYGRKE